MRRFWNNLFSDITQSNEKFIVFIDLWRKALEKKSCCISDDFVPSSKYF